MGGETRYTRCIERTFKQTDFIERARQFLSKNDNLCVVQWLIQKMDCYDTITLFGVSLEELHFYTISKHFDSIYLRAISRGGGYSLIWAI